MLKHEVRQSLPTAKWGEAGAWMEKAGLLHPESGWQWEGGGNNTHEWGWRRTGSLEGGWPRKGLEGPSLALLLS